MGMAKETYALSECNVYVFTAKRIRFGHETYTFRPQRVSLTLRSLVEKEKERNGVGGARGLWGGVN